MFEALKTASIFKERPTIKINQYRCAEHWHYFSFSESEQTHELYLFQILREEEKEKWKAFKEMLQYGIQLVLPETKGFFGLNVVFFNLGEGLRSFDTLTWKQLLLNHIKSMQTGEKRLVKYGDVFSLLHKRIPEDFGKIEFKANLPIFKKEEEKLDLWIKQGLNKTEGFAGEEKKEIIFQDLSFLPLLDISNREQQERLKKLLENERQEILYLSHRQKEKFD